MDKLSYNLYTPEPTHKEMSTTRQSTVKGFGGLPVAIGFLIAVLVFTMFVVGYDQGQLFSVVEGQSAFDNMWVHELTHDMRHAAGFPCH